jgi:PAS domain S-box-containing protein
MAGSADRGFDAESLLRSLMENVPGAIYRAVNDSEWTVLRVSNKIETITGYPAASFVDASKLQSVTHPADREPVDREIAAALSEDRPWVLEHRVVHADGGIRWVHERGVKTVDRDGREWVDGIIFDVTERRAAKQIRVERELEELRELARGIHPAVLTDKGLGPAVRALVGRCAVPVELDDSLGQWPAPAVETALYYAASEAHTNVDRYATASRATVRLRRDGDSVEVEVADDGRGGADPARGSGLRGLEDRLGAVNGVLELDGPPAGGTRLRARVPISQDEGP